MKKMKLTVTAMAIATAGLFAFNSIQTASVKGTVTPAEGGVRAWALSATDTFRSAITNGTFDISGVKAGTYQIIIEAKAPYKNTSKEGVVVAEGQPTDIGEIKLDSAKAIN